MIQIGRDSVACDPNIIRSGLSALMMSSPADYQAEAPSAFVSKYTGTVWSISE